jgi:hypothetical protein
LSNVRPDTPTTAASLSRVLPVEWSGSFPDLSCPRFGRPPCFNRSFASARSSRLQSSGDTDEFTRDERFAFGILIAFSSQSVGGVGEIVDDANGHVAPTEQTDSGEPACTGNQPSLAVNDYRMKQPQVGDAGGETP